MLNQPDMEKAYFQLCRDKRITVWHISLFMAVLYIWKESGYENPVQVTRTKIMTLSHINSIVTYHKNLKELQQYGYIEYKPSYNPYLGSRIKILLHT